MFIVVWFGNVAIMDLLNKYFKRVFGGKISGV